MGCRIVCFFCANLSCKTMCLVYIEYYLGNEASSLTAAPMMPVSFVPHL